MSNGLLYRHSSSGVNNNRGRANRVSRAFVCEDFLLADLPVDDAFGTAREGAAAVREQPGCSGCHAPLDPIASAFYGFGGMPTNSGLRTTCEAGDACFPVATWVPSQAGDWALNDMPEPAWLGQPVSDLAELGAQIAADPRFFSCAVQRFAGWMQQRSYREIGGDDITMLAADFSAHQNARQLARAAIDLEDFRTAPPMPVRPEQYARMVADLTGFVWTDEHGVELLTSDRVGYRSIAGGIDHYFTFQPDLGPTPGAFLAYARLAEQAAAFAVARDLNLSSPALLEPNLRDSSDVSDALDALHLRVLGAVPNPTDQAANWELWQSTQSRAGRQHAWKVVLTAMLEEATWY